MLSIGIRGSSGQLILGSKDAKLTGRNRIVRWEKMRSPLDLAKSMQIA